MLYTLFYILSQNFAIRDKNTGYMKLVNTISDNNDDIVYIVKDDHNLVSNKIVVKVHNIFNINAIAADYN